MQANQKEAACLEGSCILTRPHLEYRPLWLASVVGLLVASLGFRAALCARNTSFTGFPKLCSYFSKSCRVRQRSRLQGFREITRWFSGNDHGFWEWAPLFLHSLRSTRHGNSTPTKTNGSNYPTPLRPRIMFQDPETQLSKDPSSWREPQKISERISHWTLSLCILQCSCSSKKRALLRSAPPKPLGTGPRSKGLGSVWAGYRWGNAFCKRLRLPKHLTEVGTILSSPKLRAHKPKLSAVGSRTRHERILSTATSSPNEWLGQNAETICLPLFMVLQTKSPATGEVSERIYESRINTETCLLRRPPSVYRLFAFHTRK